MSEKICRLCLQTISGNNYQTVGKSAVKTLKLNIKIAEGNVMCPMCSNHLQIFSNIKTACGHRKNRTWPLPALKNDLDSEVVEIDRISNMKAPMATQTKCSFCAKIDRREGFVSLHESKKHESLVSMLEQHIPEMNLNNIEKLLTCELCLNALQGVASFILKCSEVEEEINKYSEMKGADVKGKIELKDVQQFRCRSTPKFEWVSLDADKLGDGCSDEIKKEHAMEAEAEIKCEKEISDPEMVIKTEYVDIKSEQSIAGDPLEMSLITSETRHKKNIKLHMLNRKSASETKYFKCVMCPYKAKRKYHLAYHLLTHKNSSEVNMFKCEMCPYETKHKSALKQHILVHKGPLETVMFKCGMCPYKTKYKCHVTRHLLTHRSPSEINVFKCEKCPFETRNKYALKGHLSTHKRRSEMNKLKCTMCSYVAKQEVHLKNHLLTHKSCSVIKMHINHKIKSLLLTDESP